MPEPSPLQHLPFRLHILYSSKESVHCLISKCIGEVIYDSHYYNRLAAPKHVKIATIISPTFPSLAPHRRKSLIKSVGVTLALVCRNLQRKFDIFRKWWCLQTSYSLQKFLNLDKTSGKVLCPEASFFCLTVSLLLWNALVCYHDQKGRPNLRNKGGHFLGSLPGWNLKTYSELHAMKQNLHA